MSKLNRRQLQKLLLKEFKMMGMAPMHAAMIGHSPFKDSSSHHDDHYEKMTVHDPRGGHKGSVSREDCCAAVMCLIECCSCPKTKQALIECCEDILAGHHDQKPC